MILHNILIDAQDDALDDPNLAEAVKAAVAAERARREEHDVAEGGELANDHTRSYVKQLCEARGYEPAYNEYDT
jgi:hypothetical protein